MKDKKDSISYPDYQKETKLKFMKVIFYSLLAVLIASGCSTQKTYLLGSWTMENLQPKKYEKLAVLVFSPNVSSRANVELAVVDAFEKEDVKAMSTFSLFTMASNMKEIKEAGITEEQIEKAMKEKVESNNFDAILIISVLDTKQHEHYVQGGGTSVGISLASPYYPMAYPTYAYPYYGYYSYTVASTSKPGYYEKTTDAFLESNLYDVASEKLIWTAQTETKKLTSVETEAPRFAKIIVDDIIKKKALLQK